MYEAVIFNLPLKGCAKIECAKKRCAKFEVERKFSELKVFKIHKIDNKNIDFDMSCLAKLFTHFMQTRTHMSFYTSMVTHIFTKIKRNVNLKIISCSYQ